MSINYVKLILAGVTILAIISAASWLYYSGGRANQDATDRQNIKAAEHANRAAMSWSDCDERDGLYHFDTGECEWPTLDRRE